MPGKQYAQIGSDGVLETYHDPFGEVTQDQVERAEEVENEIRFLKDGISASFLTLGVKLDVFDREELYLARGYPSLRAWSQSPEVELGYRVVNDLIRIERELMPVLREGYGEQAISKALAIGVSKLRALLPLLNDGNTEAIQELAEAADALTWGDLRDEVKSARGQEEPLDTPKNALFTIKVQKGGPYYNGTITASDTVDFYEVGRVRVKAEHWARFEQIFGRYAEVECGS